MKTITTPKYPVHKRLVRWFKLRYLKLLRAKGGASKVARGFSIGIAVEMFTLPTFGLAAVLILPMAYLFRASIPGALIGFVIGKTIYIPMAFLNRIVGGMVVPPSWHENLGFLPDWMETVVSGALDLIFGGMINGALLGLLLYMPVYLTLEWVATKRRERRKKRVSPPVILVK
jgi:uncharacterized protein